MRSEREDLRDHIEHLHERQESKSPKHQNYETKPNRYSLFGWNRDSQQCYTDTDKNFLSHIRHEFEAVFGSKKAETYFNTLTESKWYGLWTCIHLNY